MPNNRFNKQVTPKGYQKGGSVRDTRKTEQMIGASISSKREKGRAKKMGGGMMKRPMMKKGGGAKGAKPITDPKVFSIFLTSPPIFIIGFFIIIPPPILPALPPALNAGTCLLNLLFGIIFFLRF